jgi:uncharacterized membrane protein HdeD (DUF308 family)
MTVSDVQPHPSSSGGSLSAKSGWVVALGAIYVLAGIVALSSVAFAATVTVLMVGIMMIVGGVAEVISAFQARPWSRALLWVLIGSLYVVAGILAFENPLLTAKFLTLLLGLSLTASGIVKVVLAATMKAGASRLAVVLSGLITIAIGVVILMHWPVASLLVLGVFLGVDLISAGVGWITVGLGLKTRH